ncbi:MAG TPA: hypothetical protein VN849_07815 [Stellaceae bacterium]|nr:hypothetical protein [Stellaceae bacterium]
MRIADARIKLVVRIGYRRWALRGGDIGDTIARKAPPGLIGLAVARGLAERPQTELGGVATR